MTDNRTNEPTDAMLDAAEKAYDDHWQGGVWGDEFGERTCQFCGHLYQTAEERKNQANSGSDLMRARSRHSLRAALVAAQGAAPQAESDCWHEANCMCAPVLPSRTVDELAKLIRRLAVRVHVPDPDGFWSDCYDSEQKEWQSVARAVVEAIGGESRG